MTEPLGKTSAGTHIGPVYYPFSVSATGGSEYIPAFEKAFEFFTNTEQDGERGKSLY